MWIVFVSNFFNHHQKYLSQALYNETNGKYLFVETDKMSDERIKMGWGGIEKLDFVVSYSDELQKKIDEADVVILGSAPDRLLNKRHKEKKLTFRYSERLFKREPSKWQIPLRVVKNYWRFGRHQNEYLLCASAYSAADFARMYAYVGKTYKWGYFPEVKTYDWNELYSYKQANKKPSILWVARLIGWKHPDASILLAQRLRDAGYEFELNIIGNGEMEDQLRQMICERHLENEVVLCGAMKPEEVRSYMEKADVFLFTSDFNEGWGAVLNESMNSGCAVVVSHAIGSVPFLIDDEKNGLIYQNGNAEDLYRKVESLICNREKRLELGKNAYRTMVEKWNAQVAAKRFLELAKNLLAGKEDVVYLDGPCSKAEILKNNWYGEEYNG